MKARLLLLILLIGYLNIPGQQKNEFYVRPISIEEYIQWDKLTDEFYKYENENKYDEMLNLSNQIVRQFPFIETGYYTEFGVGILKKKINIVKNGLDGMADKYFFSLNTYINLYNTISEIDDKELKKEVENAYQAFLQKRNAFLEDKLINNVNLKRIYKELVWVNYLVSNEDGFLMYLDKVMKFDYQFINKFNNRDEWVDEHFNTFASAHYQNLQKWNNTLEEKMNALLILSNHLYDENASLDFAPITDWNQHVTSYLPRIIASQTKQEFYEILAEMVGYIGENHTNIQFPSDIWRAHSGCGIDLYYGSERFIVKNVQKAELADRIKPGDVIIAVDGVPTSDYIEKNKHRFPFVSYYFMKSNPYRMRAFSNRLLFGEKDSKVAVEFKKPSGETYSVELIRDSYKLSQSGSGSNKSLIEFKILDGGIWYFNIKRFYGGNIYQQFLDLIKDMKTEEANGLIIDIRENSGGNSYYGDKIFSHLISQTAIKYAHNYYPVRIPMQEFRGYGKVTLHRGGYKQESSQTQKFNCPVVVLISTETGSAAEDFADLFRQNNRGQLVGLPTAGGTGNGHQIFLPGGGSARVCLNVDLGFSWVGVQPDYYVDFTPEDIAAGRDPQLEKAVSLLKIQ